MRAKMNGMGRLTRTRTVLKLGPGADTAIRAARRSDVLAVEEPLEIRLGGRPYLVTMRTPGDDVDLVHGLLYAEGVIETGADVVLARYCAGTGADGLNTYNVLDVSLTPERARPAAEPVRQVVTGSGCGICGATSIEQVLSGRRHPVTRTAVVPWRHVLDAPVRLRERQHNFSRTGGLHGAGLIDAAGELVCAREDVGRHNALDKVIGWALRQGRLPLVGGLLVVSSRASYELTQKAVAAGAELLVAVSAPSSLAVELADEAGLTLVAFVRGETMNVYTHADRVELTRPTPVQADPVQASPVQAGSGAG